MSGAGSLDRRIRFEKRMEKNDGRGNPVSGDWLPQFTLWARRRWLRGGETVLAARLESRQPVVLTVRATGRSRLITSDWRAVDEGDGAVYNIRENPKEGDSRAYLDMLAESGVAT